MPLNCRKSNSKKHSNIGYLAVGNFIPYLASYLTASQFGHNISTGTQEVLHSYSAHAALCNWLLPAFTLGYALFGTVGGVMQLYWDTRYIAIFAGSIIVLQFLLTHSLTNNWYVIILCSFGVLYGVDCGIVWSPAIACVLQWFPQNKALLMGLLMSTVTLGSICYSLLSTLPKTLQIAAITFNVSNVASFSIKA